MSKEFAEIESLYKGVIAFMKEGNEVKAADALLKAEYEYNVNFPEIQLYQRNTIVFYVINACYFYSARNQYLNLEQVCDRESEKLSKNTLNNSSAWDDLNALGHLQESISNVTSALQDIPFIEKISNTSLLDLKEKAVNNLNISENECLLVISAVLHRYQYNKMLISIKHLMCYKSISDDGLRCKASYYMKAASAVEFSNYYCQEEALSLYAKISEKTSDDHCFQLYLVGKLLLPSFEMPTFQTKFSFSNQFLKEMIDGWNAYKDNMKYLFYKFDYGYPLPCVLAVIYKYMMLPQAETPYSVLKVILSEMLNDGSKNIKDDHLLICLLFKMLAFFVNKKADFVAEKNAAKIEECQNIIKSIIGIIGLIPCREINVNTHFFAILCNNLNMILEVFNKIPLDQCLRRDVENRVRLLRITIQLSKQKTFHYAHLADASHPDFNERYRKSADTAEYVYECLNQIPIVLRSSDELHDLTIYARHARRYYLLYAMQLNREKSEKADSQPWLEKAAIFAEKIPLTDRSNEDLKEEAGIAATLARTYSKKEFDSNSVLLAARKAICCYIKVPEKTMNNWQQLEIMLSLIIKNGDAPPHFFKQICPDNSSLNIFNEPNINKINQFLVAINEMPKEYLAFKKEVLAIFEDLEAQWKKPNGLPENLMSIFTTNQRVFIFSDVLKMLKEMLAIEEKMRELDTSRPLSHTDTQRKRQRTATSYYLLPPPSDSQTSSRPPQKRAAPAKKS